jgi:hypothetical protein
MKKTVIAAALFTAFVAAAFAQSFYVVQDVKTKKCTVTETKPTSTEVTVVSGEYRLQDQGGSRERHEDRQGLHVELTREGLPLLLLRSACSSKASAV